MHIVKAPELNFIKSSASYDSYLLKCHRHAGLEFHGEFIFGGDGFFQPADKPLPQVSFLHEKFPRAPQRMGRKNPDAAETKICLNAKQTEPILEIEDFVDKIFKT